MTAMFARWRPSLLALITVVAVAAPGMVQAQSVLTVRLDQARIEKLPVRVSTIVIGNPLIADVSLQQGGLMVLTGKGYGVTNLIALDRGGSVLAEHTIQVQGPTDGVVVVYRGMAQETYSCTPRCERRITLGDAPEFFDATINQSGSRNLRAQGAGAAAPTGQAPAR
jgi:Flp pilus assembly secretin CpaC